MRLEATEAALAVGERLRRCGASVACRWRSWRRSVASAGRCSQRSSATRACPRWAWRCGSRRSSVPLVQLLGWTNARKWSFGRPPHQEVIADPPLRHHALPPHWGAGGRAAGGAWRRRGHRPGPATAGAGGVAGDQRRPGALPGDGRRRPLAGGRGGCAHHSRSGVRGAAPAPGRVGGGRPHLGVGRGGGVVAARSREWHGLCPDHGRRLELSNLFLMGF